MKILHILKTEPHESIIRIIAEHKKDNDVEVIDLRNTKDYDFIINAIENADKIICL